MSRQSKAHSGATKAAKPKVPRSGPSAAVIPTLPLWQQYQRIGGGITPQQVSAILYQADAGDVSRLVDLANEARQKDGHLQCVLHTRETSLASLGLNISPFKKRGRKEPTATDAKTAAFVEDAIANAVGNGQDLRSFDDLIAHLQGAVYHGFSVAEIAWERVGRFTLPAGFRLINQRRFRFRERDGRLVWSDYWATGSGVDLAAEYPGQFITHMPRVNGDVPAREGLARLLVWAALFRNWSISDWLKLAELAWKPWRIGKYKKGIGNEDKENLLRMLERLTTNGIAIHSEEVEMDLRTPGASGSSASSAKGPHQQLCDFMGAEMSKSVLGQTLTTEAGDKGARALGEVHDAVRKDIRKNDASAVYATLRRDLFRHIVQMNLGDKPLPDGCFNTDDAVDLKTFGESLGHLKNVGMRVPVKWAHDMAGVPEPDEDEAVLGESAEGEAQPDENDPSGDESDSDGESEQPDENDDGAPQQEAPDEGSEDE